MRAQEKCRPVSPLILPSPGGPLPEGHTVSAEVLGELEIVGSVENTIDTESVTITDAEGNDVTSNYKIAIVNGTLTFLEKE